MSRARRVAAGVLAMTSAGSLATGGYLLYAAHVEDEQRQHNERIITAPRTDLGSPSPARAGRPAVSDRQTTWQTSAGRTMTPLPAFDAGAARAAGPSMLVIPSVGLRIKLVTSGVTGGILEVPSPRLAGRWVGSQSPGSTRGAFVVAGHVNDRTGAPAPMSLAADVEPGMSVWVTDTASHPHRFVVTSRTETQKDQLPPSVFTVDRPMHLSLITCGGPVVPDARVGGRSHRDNVIVTAVPVPKES